VVATGSEAVGQKLSGNAHLIAEFDARPRSQRAEADAILEQLVRQMLTAGQAMNLGALENPDPKARAELPVNVSRPLLERFQEIDRRGYKHISVFLIDARP
jgi:hypothetical protein